MSTAKYLINRIERSGGFHSLIHKKSGWLLTCRLDSDQNDTYINVLKDGWFVISMPIGNKVKSDFFPPEERAILLDYFKGYGCVANG